MPSLYVPFATPRRSIAKQLDALIAFARDHGGSDALVMRILHQLGAADIMARGGLMFDDTTLRDETGRDLIAEGLLRPSALEVRYRAEILVTCATRALFEEDAGKPDEANAVRERLLAWLSNDAARLAACEPSELSFLRTPIGGANAQEVINRVWECEAACVMLWALSAFDMPHFAYSEHPYEVGNGIGVNAAETPENLRAPRLRSDAELEAMHRELTGIHWRMREYDRDCEKPVDFVAFAAANFFGQFSVDGLDIIENDLAIGDDPLSRTFTNFGYPAVSIARERHRGINWVMGVQRLFSDVQAPT